MVRPGSSFPIRLVRLASHDHRAVERHFAEMLQIRLQTPRQLTITANDQVLTDRCDQHDFHNGAPFRSIEKETGSRQKDTTLLCDRPIICIGQLF